MIDGLVVVDKEAGYTSHDVVARCRRVFGQSKVGHAGTLDPGATGVLLIGLGKATRLLRFIGSGSKRYRGELVLGASTTTLDASGEIVARFDMGGVDAGSVQRCAATLTGEIEQVPPMVSAKKVGGVRLHALARQGLEVERPSSRVTVDSFEVAPLYPDGEGGSVFSFEVVCSAGTYVRTLVDDLGKLLGGGAHLRTLRRTASGSFTAGEARPVDAIAECDVLDLGEALREMDQFVVGDEVAREIGFGRPITLPTLGAKTPGPWCLVAGDGRVLAVYERRGGQCRPAVVLEPAG